MEYIKLIVRGLFIICSLPARIVFILAALGGWIEGWACNKESQKQESRKMFFDMLKPEPYNQ